MLKSTEQLVRAPPRPTLKLDWSHVPIAHLQVPSPELHATATYYVHALTSFRRASTSTYSCPVVSSQPFHKRLPGMPPLRPANKTSNGGMKSTFLR